MTIEITKYRGYAISFDTEKETFLSDIGNDGSEKKSFAATKKAIDEYIRDNQVFVPFEVVHVGWNNNMSKIRTILGIRKDGRFIYDEDGKKQQISEHSEDEFYLLSDWKQFDRTEMNRLKEDKKAIDEKLTAIKKKEDEFLKTQPTLKALKPKYII